MTDAVNHPPRVIRDPELAAVLAELRRTRAILDRIESALVKPVPQAQVVTPRKWWEFWR